MVAARTLHVRQRAAGRCEYCRLPQKATHIPFEIDHIINCDEALTLRESLLPEGLF
jgi:hypothetical protein